MSCLKLSFVNFVMPAYSGSFSYSWLSCIGRFSKRVSEKKKQITNTFNFQKFNSAAYFFITWAPVRVIDRTLGQTLSLSVHKKNKGKHSSIATARQHLPTSSRGSSAARSPCILPKVRSDWTPLSWLKQWPSGSVPLLINCATPAQLNECGQRFVRKRAEEQSFHYQLGPTARTGEERRNLSGPAGEALFHGSPQLKVLHTQCPVCPPRQRHQVSVSSAGLHGTWNSDKTH